MGSGAGSSPRTHSHTCPPPHTHSHTCPPPHAHRCNIPKHSTERNDWAPHIATVQHSCVLSPEQFQLVGQACIYRWIGAIGESSEIRI